MAMGQSNKRSIGAIILLMVAMLFAPTVDGQVRGDRKIKCDNLSPDNGSETTCLCVDTGNDLIFHDLDCDGTLDANESPLPADNADLLANSLTITDTDTGATGNKLIISNNDGLSGDRTCAVDGTAGEFTLFDADSTSDANVDVFVFCDGTTEAFRIDADAITFANTGLVTTNDITVDGKIDIGTNDTFDPSDATPDVSTGSNWTSNGTTFTITDFDGAGLAEGDLLYVKSGGATTYDCVASGLDCGTADIVTAAGDTTTWIYDGTNWDLIAYMDVSTDMGTDGGGGGTLDTIGDPAAAKTFNHADTETLAFDSASDGESFFTISLNTDTAAATEALLITTSATADATYVPLLIQDTSDGTPNDLLKVDYTGTITQAATAAPTILLDDSITDGADTSPESKIVADTDEADNGSFSFQVEEADSTYYEGIQLESTAGAVTLELMGNDTANFVQVAEGGAMTFEGNADIDLPTDSVDTADITALNVTQDKLAASLAFDDGDLLDFSGLTINSATEGIILPQIGSACASAIGQGQICWDTVGKDLYIGDSVAPVQMNTGSGITDIFNCSSGDCAEVIATDGDRLDFDQVDPNSADEGILLPQQAGACVGAGQEGQICWDSTNDNLYIGDGTSPVQMNAAAPSTEVRSMYWGAGAISASTGCTTAAESAIVTSGPLTFTIPCDPAVDTDGLMYFSTVLPDGFNKTADVTFEISLQMTEDSGAGTAYMSAAIQCTEQDTIFDTTFGTPIAASHTFVDGDLVDELTQMTTAAVDTDTTGENCDPGELMFVKLSMCGDDATPTTGCSDNNTFENDFSILGVKIEYTTNIGD